jgi:hypothetical protein
MCISEFSQGSGQTKQRADVISALAEHSLVVFTHNVLHNSIIIPKGTKGTIVAVYKNGEDFEVEITTPIHAVVSASLEDLRKDTDF